MIDRTNSYTCIARPAGLQRRLMTSAAVAAGLPALTLALALAPPSRAQGVAGTGVVNSGLANINTPNASTTRVTTTSQQTIVTWRPTDTATTGAPINFLPAGNSWEFVGTQPGYTVLNRFLGVDGSGNPIPITRQIALNGTISSVLDLGATTVPGGNIWFYNAGGILIGSTGVINVGSLVLTSNDIDTTGGLFDLSGNIRFRGPGGSTSAIEVASGAAITVANTNPGGAYTAFVAPRIVQRGTVSTDGSTAYVAAEQADIRINQGLFDINVLVGAEGGTVIDHSGETTGPAAQDGDPNDSRIYMVAIPKNDAVTMLVAGQVGYQDPVVAQVDPNGAIRLSAGRDIFAGEIVANPNPASTAAANIAVQDIIFNSEIVARASGSLTGAPQSTLSAGPLPQRGQIRFNADALLQGDNLTRLSIGNDQRIVAAQALRLVAAGRGAASGTAELLLNYNAAAPGARPTVTVGSQLAVDASRTAFDLTGNAGGGTARIGIDGGLLTASDIAVRADGIADYPFGAGATGGAGTGGSAAISVARGQVAAISISVSANGEGAGDRFNANLGIAEYAAQGGAGQGGSATVTASAGGTLTGLQALSLSAAGIGGTGSARGGEGRGGLARIAVSGAASGIASSSTVLDATGSGGGPLEIPGPAFSAIGQGGDGFGGTAEIIGDGTNAFGGTIVDTGGFGGDATVRANRGGSGSGGLTVVALTGGATSFGSLNLRANGRAGNGAAITAAAGPAGSGNGGSIEFSLANGSLTADDVAAEANGTGGSGSAAGGLGSGGSADLNIGGGTVQVAGGISFTVDGTGGVGVAGTPSGNGAGGNIGAAMAGGTLLAADLNLSARGVGGDGVGGLDGGPSGGGIRVGGDAGDGAGGSIGLTLNGGTATLGGLTLAADGRGGEGGGFTVTSSGLAGDVGNGGDGSGGSATLTLNGASIIIDATRLDVGAAGGAGGTVTSFSPIAGGTSIGGAGGDAAGGTATVNLSTSSATGGDLELLGLALGGAGSGGFNAASGDGGDAAGGNAVLAQTNTANTLDDVSMRVSAVGGAGGSTLASGAAGGAGGRGGAGAGGTVSVTAAGTGSELVLGSPDIGANGTGGTGGTGWGVATSNGAAGGEGTGGTLSFAASGGGRLDLAVAAGLVVVGRGGTGGAGAVGAPIAPFPATAADGANGTAPGQAGGTGGTGADGAIGNTGGTGGQGGNGTGGTITLTASTGGTIDNGVFSLAATGFGGRGGVGGAGGTGGAGQGGGSGGNGGAGASGGNGGRGGNGGTGGDAGAGGSGGNGRGGDVLLFVNGGTIRSGDLSVSTSGGGGLRGDNGAGGAGGLAGEGGVGGLGGGTPGSDGSAGPNGTVGPTGCTGCAAATTIPGVGGGGAITFRTRGTGNNLTAGTVSLVSNAILPDDIEIFSGNAGTVQFDLGNSDGGAPIILDELTVEALGDPMQPGVDNIVMTAGTARIEVPGNMTLRATNAVRIGAVGGGRIAVGGNLNITGTAITAQSVQVTGNANLDAVTGLTGALDVTGSTTLDADSGAIDLDLRSGSAVTASANNITIRSGGALSFAAIAADTGAANVTTSGELRVQSGTLAAGGRFESTGGDVILDTLSVTGGNFAAIADDDMTLGTITAAAQFSGEAGDVMTVNGRVAAPQIRLLSGDIVVSNSAQLGVLGTTQSLFVASNNPNAPTFIGGTGTRAGWHLDAAEITRLAGGSVTLFGESVTAPGNVSVGSARAPDVVLDDLTFNAATQLGANGTFRIDTRGKLRTVGDVRFTGMTDAQGLTIVANDALEVILGDGSIYLNDANGALAGTLSLESDDIAVATLAAINAAATLTTTDAISARLDQNDGIVSDTGALAANRINLTHTTSTSILVQNSGAGTAFADRRGITVGAGGLFIAGPGNGDRIVINGVQQAAGGNVTGLALIPLVSINGSASAPSGFDPRSTINGCAIGNVAACSTTRPPSGEPESNFPVQDVIEEEVEGDGGSGDDSITAPLITLRGVDPLTGQPLVDDPVTGAGNEDLWTPSN